MSPSSASNNYEQFRLGSVQQLQASQGGHNNPSSKALHLASLNADSNNRLTSSEPEYIRIARTVPGQGVGEANAG